MKRLLTITIISLLFLSCSKDDSPSEVQTCQMKVYVIGTGSAPGGTTTYNITYGTSGEASNQVNTFVSKEVYDFYVIKNQEAQPDRAIWKGEITE